MAHTNAWNNGAPLGSEFASSIDNHMRAMKIDTSERMAIAFTWNTSQEWDGYPISLPFRGVDNAPLIYTHLPNTINGDLDVGLIELEQTWNTTAAPTALWMNITDTASAADSMLFEFLVNGVAQASLRKDGLFTAAKVSFDNILAGSILPKADNSYALGSTTFRWSHVHSFGATFSGGVTFNGPVVFNSTVAGGIVTSDMTLTGNLTVAGDAYFAKGLSAGPDHRQIIDASGRIPMIHAYHFVDLTGAYITGIGHLDTVNAWQGRQDFTSYTEEHTSIAITGGVLTVDLALGSVFEFTLNQPLNMNLINVPPSGKYGSFVLIVNVTGVAHGWAWFQSTVRWPGGTAPTYTPIAGKIDKYFFWTRNGGATWHGTTVAQNYAP